MNYMIMLVSSLALVVFIIAAGVTTMTDFGRQGLSNAQDAGAAVTTLVPVVAQQSTPPQPSSHRVFDPYGNPTSVVF
jgi:hypothetical protein